MEEVKVKVKDKRYSSAKKIAALAIVLGILTLGLAGWVVTLAVQNHRANMTIENMYQRSFYELSDSVNNLELNLSKLMIAEGDEQSAALAMEVYKSAETALDAVSRLPLEHVDVVSAEKFFNQVGDFSLSFNRSLSAKRDSSAYRDKIEELYITARWINQSVIEEAQMLQENGYNFRRMQDARMQKQKEHEVQEGGETENKTDTIEYPEMIYDGPFSDSTTKRCYKALENLEQVSLTTAEEIVREKIPYQISEVVLTGESESMAPSYHLALKTSSGDAYATVAKNGGIILNFNIYRDVTNVQLGEAAAKAKAEEYARTLGFDVKPIWYNVIGGVAIINLAPVKNEVVFYTDLVKIKIALDDGALLGVEANGYCMNHCERDYKPTMNEAAARSTIPAKLSVNNVRLAVIPDGESEILSYEIAAEYKGLDYFVFIDAHDGRQINILRVIDRDQGKMTI